MEDLKPSEALLSKPTNQHSNEQVTDIKYSQWARYRVLSFYFGLVLMSLSVIGLAMKGLNWGIDFSGGYLIEYRSSVTHDHKQMHEALTRYISGDIQLSRSGDGHEWKLRLADSGHIEQAWLSDFASQSDFELELISAAYIGSQVGDELVSQGGMALMVATIVILLYLALRFEWRLALGSVVALVHDVLIVLGVFAWLGISFDLTVLASILAIMGYSLNDSIIVGDRVRELMYRQVLPLDDVIFKAIKSMFTRTLVTSGTTLATVIAIWLFAGEPLRGFAIALFIGVLVGTYSSICISLTVAQRLNLSTRHYQDKQVIECQEP